MTGSWKKWTPLAFLLPLGFLFAGPLLGRSILFFRDISLEYFPDYVFVARALREGVWPLWNPTCDAGMPFVKAYPLELALLWLLGARATLAVVPPLHLLIAMWGSFRLARDLGVSRQGAWLAGAGLGLSGMLLSSLLFPSFLASAWAPWIILAVRELVSCPSPGRLVRLSVFTALQLSTFGAAVVIQTALAALVLLPRRPATRAWKGLAAAALLSAVLAAPALLGALELSRGSARGAGFERGSVLAYSASLPVLAESVWPRLFGDPHTMTLAGYWGQPFYPEGDPFYASLYVGPVLALLALAGCELRLAGLALLGIALSLGRHGPLGDLLALVSFVRVPVKYFFLTTLSTSLMAGRGLDRLRARPGRSLWGLAAAAVILLLAALAYTSPASPARLAHQWWPRVETSRAAAVIARDWPGELLATGAVLLAAVASLRSATVRGLPLVPALLVLDLLRVNLVAVPLADPGFYDLRPASKGLVHEMAAVPGARLHSYGVAYSGSLDWRPDVLRHNRDIWLFYLDRQALLSRSQVLDGLDAAFEVDRNGWAPRGASLAVAQADAAHYRSIHDRLRLAAVRFVLSFQPLPADLVRLRTSVRLPEIEQPLGLFELRDALPRAWLVPGYHLPPAGFTGLQALAHGLDFDPRESVLLERPPPPAPTAGPPGQQVGAVEYHRVSPHEVRISATGPPGLIVVADGWDPGWRAEDARGDPVSLLRANGRYWALPKPAGRIEYAVHFRPAWEPWALASTGLGCLAALLLVVRGPKPGPDAQPDA